jgi:hypothetical protein
MRKVSLLGILFLVSQFGFSQMSQQESLDRLRNEIVWVSAVQNYVNVIVMEYSIYDHRLTIQEFCDNQRKGGYKILSCEKKILFPELVNLMNSYKSCLAFFTHPLYTNRICSLILDKNDDWYTVITSVR